MELRQEAGVADDSPEPPGVVQVDIRRDALKVGDLRLLDRVRRTGLAVATGQSLPPDAVTDVEIRAFWDRVVVGGVDAVEELPLMALPGLWAQIRALAYGTAGARAEQLKNSDGG